MVSNFFSQLLKNHLWIYFGTGVVTMDNTRYFLLSILFLSCPPAEMIFIGDSVQLQEETYAKGKPGVIC